MEKYVKIPSGEFYKISYDGTKIEVNEVESVPTRVRVKAFDLIEKIEIVKEESAVNNIIISFFSGSELTTQNESTLDNYINDYMKLLGLNYNDVTIRNDFISHLKESGVIEEQITYDKYYHKGENKVRLSFEENNLTSVQGVYEIPEDANSEEKDIIVKVIINKDKDGNIKEYIIKRLSGSKDIRKNQSEEDIKKVKEELWKTYSVSSTSYEDLSEEQIQEFENNLSSLGIMKNSMKKVKNLNIRPKMKKMLALGVAFTIAAVSYGIGKSNNNSHQSNQVQYYEDPYSSNDLPEDDYPYLNDVPQTPDYPVESFDISENSQGYVYYTEISPNGVQSNLKSNTMSIEDLYQLNSDSISRISNNLNNPEAEVGNGICAYYNYSLDPSLANDYITYFSELDNEIIRRFYLNGNREELENYIVDVNSAIVQHIRDDYPVYCPNYDQSIKYSELSDDAKRFVLWIALSINEPLCSIGKDVDINGEIATYKEINEMLKEEYNNIQSLSR